MDESKLLSQLTSSSIYVKEKTADRPSFSAIHLHFRGSKVPDVLRGVAHGNGQGQTRPCSYIPFLDNVAQMHNGQCRNQDSQ